jgi:hypothetical protein
MAVALRIKLFENKMRAVVIRNIARVMDSNKMNNPALTDLVSAH